MKQWIERHKRILQKAASALLAFMVGVCLVFMIHPVQTLPKDRLLSLSRMQEDTSFGAQVQLGYGTPVKGLYPYTIEFQKQDDDFYLSSIQGFAPKSSHYQSKKDLKQADFTGYQTLDGKKEKGTAVEEVLKKSGLPNSLSLTSVKDKQVLALSYQVTDGLVSLTFERDQSGQYRLTKKG